MFEGLRMKKRRQEQGRYTVAVARLTVTRDLIHCTGPAQGQEKFTMADVTSTTMPRSDRERLRDLARQKVEIANDPVNLERKREWYRHRRREPGRPLILVETWEIAGLVGAGTGGVCTSEQARPLESYLLVEQYMWNQVKDDHVVLPTIQVGWQVSASDYGVAATYEHGQGNQAGRGSSRWDAPIKDLDADFSKLKPRTFSVNREPALKNKAFLDELFGDILTIELGGGSFWWTMGLTNPLIGLVGLENMMYAMFDQPDGLHRIMAFLRDDHLAFARWVEKEGLLTPNNTDHYIGSGSLGFTEELPGPGYIPGQPARLKDMWVLSESQETVLVSPEMFEEFIFPYQLAVAKEFGLCYYGCCEPVNNRWHILKRIPNLRAVSVSPWADQAVMAEACGREVLYCRKPNPAIISTSHFDEDAIRSDIRQTLEVARGCNVEIVMKDIHTIAGEKHRPARWVQLAREECNRMRSA